KWKERLRNMIETYGHAAWGQVQPAFHKAGEEIAGHSKGRDHNSDVPPKPHQRWADWRRQQGRDDSTNGFRRPEYGPAIDKKSATVERSRKCSPEKLLGCDSCAVSNHQQDQQLQQQNDLHEGVP